MCSQKKNQTQSAPKNGNSNQNAGKSGAKNVSVLVSGSFFFVPTQFLTVKHTLKSQTKVILKQKEKQHQNTNSNWKSETKKSKLN